MATLVEKFRNACNRFPKDTHVLIHSKDRLIVVTREAYENSKADGNAVKAEDVECTIRVPFLVS
jgi:hypothetical protein